MVIVAEAVMRADVANRVAAGEAKKVPGVVRTAVEIM